MQATFDRLNEMGRKGIIVAVGSRSIFGPNYVALANNKAAIRRVDELPKGRAGAIFYLVSGWELLVNGKVVARWTYSPRQVEEKVRAYSRAARWLLLKAERHA